MKFLVAAGYEFLKNLRDLKMIVFLIVFPIVTIYLIGSAVQGFFEPDTGRVIEVAYVNEDEGVIGRGFDAFFGSEEIKDSLKISKYDSAEEGEKALSDGSGTVLVSVPEGLSDSIMRGESGSVEVSGNTGLDIVETMVNSYTSSVNANMAAAEAGLKPVAAERADAVIRVDRTKNGSYPSLIDYYAILILLEALVIGAIFGAYISARNYDSDIHIRIHALPVHSMTLLFGRVLGSVAYLLLTSAATMLFTGCVYGVNWGGNLPVMLGALALFCTVMVGIGVVCGRVLKKISTAIMMVFALMFFFGTVSGSVSPLSGATALGFLTPNYYAKILLFGSIYGYSDHVMINSALWLAAIAAAVYALVIVLMRRVQHDNF